eukprot:gnl/TRDRNA2_/TRDRNA2_80294_c0_seq1.p1 gnl/TRDRNA2_/TRDRNA2_80294_c0~~gnl/TRDRNA2_/TRDRNA2_80294_c0_seq1.p1  ORF type:complete len:416 (-),score=64.97 gnl/TRDRNA2_/TRDRNA2_80294_c0_seq1:223-1470(-)
MASAEKQDAESSAAADVTKEEDGDDGIVRRDSQVFAAFRKLDAGLKKGSWRHKMTVFMESSIVEVIVLILVIVDIILVCIEAGIDHHVFCVDGHHLPGITQTTVLAPYKDIAEEANLLQVGPPDWNDPLYLSPPHFDAALSLRGRVTSLSIGPGPNFVSDKLSAKGGHDPLALLAAPPDNEIKAKPRGLRTAHKIAKHQAENPKEEDDIIVEPEPRNKHGHAKGWEHHSDHGHDEHGGHHGDEHHGGHPLGPPGALVCEDRYGHEATHIVHQCHIWSIVILCIFVVELSIKLALNPKEFCGNPFHVLDLIVVVLSLVVDTVVMWYISENFDTMKDNQAEIEVITALLIICRVWRVVRIVHGIFEITHNQAHKQEHIEHEIEELEEKNRQLEEELAALKPKDEATAPAPSSSAEVS